MLVPYPMKWYFETLLGELGELDATPRQQIISTMSAQIKAAKDRLTEKESNYHNKFTRYLLNYMEKKLTSLY